MIQSTLTSVTLLETCAEKWIINGVLTAASQQAREISDCVERYPFESMKLSAKEE